MRQREPSEYYLFIGKYYPKDENNNPVSINKVWHDLLAENNPNILSGDIISAALHSKRDLIKLDNLVKLQKLCSFWSGADVRIEDLLFTKEQLAEARSKLATSDFFAEKRKLSMRHREALSLCRLIGEGNEASEWTEGLKKAALSIAEQELHTSATAFLRKYRYSYNSKTGKYSVKPELRNALITRYAGRDINWTKEVTNE